MRSDVNKPKGVDALTPRENYYEWGKEKTWKETKRADLINTRCKDG